MESRWKCAVLLAITFYISVALVRAVWLHWLTNPANPTPWPIRTKRQRSPTRVSPSITFYGFHQPLSPKGVSRPKPNRMYVFQRMCLSRANVVQTSIIAYATSLYFAIYRSNHRWFQQLSPTSPPNSSVSVGPVARAPHGSDFHANSWNLLLGGKEISGAQQRTGV